MKISKQFALSEVNEERESCGNEEEEKKDVIEDSSSSNDWDIELSQK